MASNRDDSELLERLEGVIERNTLAFARGEQRFELNRLAFERTFAGIDAMVKVIEDMRQDIRANTQAVLKLLDRFDNGGQTA